VEDDPAPRLSPPVAGALALCGLIAGALLMGLSVLDAALIALFSAPVFVLVALRIRRHSSTAGDG